MAMRVIVKTVPECYHVARHHPSQLDAAAGADQGLHREPQVQRLPVAPHHHLRARRPALRGADPHPGDAPHRRVRHRGPLDLQDRRQGADELDRAPRLVPPAARAAAGHAQPRGIPRVPQGRPLPGRDLRVHAAGRREAAAQGRHADRLRLPRAHRGRARSARAPRSTAGSRRCTASSRTATRSRSSPARTRKPEPRLAQPRAHRARAPQDQAVDQARGGDGQPPARAGDPRAASSSAAGSTAPTTRRSWSAAAAALGLADARGARRSPSAGATSPSGR